MTNLVHGGDIYTAKEKAGRPLLDFSANINPLGLPEGVKQAITQGLAQCVNYPDPLCRELTEALSREERLPSRHILCGNGAADLIFRLVLARKPQRALLPAPTFAEYEQALRTVDCGIEYYPLSEETGFAFQSDFFHRLEGDQPPEMVFLCNPNNPTGRLIPGDFLRKTAELCREKGILLVLDECFIEFVERGRQESLGALVESNPSLLILKAFTKHYAMPGLRLGYCLCSDSQLLHQMEKSGQPWSVSVLAQLAGVAALKESQYLEEMTALISREREFLWEGLQRLPVKVYPPAANYILLRVDGMKHEAQSRSFQQALLQKGILIRDCSNYRGLTHGYYRVAVKDRQSNEVLLQALREALEEALREL